MSIPAAGVLKPDFAAPRRHFIFDRGARSVPQDRPGGARPPRRSSPRRMGGDGGIPRLGIPDPGRGGASSVSRSPELRRPRRQPRLHRHLRRGAGAPPSIGFAVAVGVQTDMAPRPSSRYGTDEPKERYSARRSPGRRARHRRHRARRRLRRGRPSAPGPSATATTGSSTAPSPSSPTATQADSILLVAAGAGTRARDEVVTPLPRRDGPARAWSASRACEKLI